MVLKEYGVKTLSNQEVTPAALNAWLKSQSDGYIRNGLVNWLAITRYTRQSYTAGKSPTKLEFVKSPYSESDVTGKLGSGLFPILGEPGHFVAAHGSSGDDWLINDPNNLARTSLAKSASIATSNTFVPSLTDLSYMLYVFDQGMNVEVSTPGGVVDGILTEEWLTDDLASDSANKLNLLYVPKPASGNYKVTVGGRGALDIYLYDKNGSNWTKKIVTSGDEEKIELSYNHGSIARTKLKSRLQRVWRYLHNRHHWSWYWHKLNWWD